MRPKTKIPAWWPRLTSWNRGDIKPGKALNWVTIHEDGSSFSTGVDYTCEVPPSKIPGMKTEFRSGYDRRQWEYEVLAVPEKSRYTETHGTPKKKKRKNASRHP